jgi:integration host factor subunit alpha
LKNLAVLSNDFYFLFILIYLNKVLLINIFLNIIFFMEKTATTRSTLSEAVYRNVGLSRNESAALVDSVFNEISKSLIVGKDVKISSFGTFIVRKKKERVGRNPKTGEEVAITARQVVTFRSSNVLKTEVADLSKNDSSGFEDNH